MPKRLVYYAARLNSTIGRCFRNDRFIGRSYQGFFERGGYRVFLGNGDNRIVRVVWVVLSFHRQFTKMTFL